MLLLAFVVAATLSAPAAPAAKCGNDAVSSAGAEHSPGGSLEDCAPIRP